MPDEANDDIEAKLVDMGRRRHATLSESDFSDIVDRIPAVYRELRDRAEACLRSFENPGTYTPTDLLHEAWLKLRCGHGQNEWTSDGHFIATAALVMRQVAVDRARARTCQKRGGGKPLASLEDVELGDRDDPYRALLIHDLLDELEQDHARCAQIVEMRFFLGLSESECAQALGVSERTIRRDWVLARSWLGREMDRRDLD